MTLGGIACHNHNIKHPNLCTKVLKILLTQHVLHFVV